MSKTIRIDSDVYAKLQELAKNKPFSSPNNILREVFGLPPVGRKQGR